MEFQGRFKGAIPSGDDEPTHLLGAGDPNSCPCEAAYDTGVPNSDPGAPHYVWLAFLHYDNDDYRKEEWIRDYRVLPTNWLTCKLSGSDIYHCQIFFWNQLQQTFVTFSVDAHQQHVHYSTQKQFGQGWTFVRLTVTREQERAMYDFLATQAEEERPFNWLGAMLLFFRPVDTGGAAWFCSQLDVAALQVAGLLTHVKPEATSPAQLKELLLRCGEVPVLETTHPVRTKQVWMRVAQHLNGTREIADNEQLVSF